MNRKFTYLSKTTLDRTLQVKRTKNSVFSFDNLQGDRNYLISGYNYLRYYINTNADNRWHYLQQLIVINQIWYSF